MRVAVDAMGGDHAPGVVVDGAVEAAREFGIHVILVGDRDVIQEHVGRHKLEGVPISIRHASQSVEMDDSPSVALRRKKDSSMRVALELVKSGGASVAVSAGNSGAFMAKSMMVLRLLPGVERPAFSTMLPNLAGGRTVVMDVGANVDCQPINLVQFAVMGEVFAHQILDIPKPRVGILSNGHEPGKGTDLTRKAHQMLSEIESINYIGYVEGRDLFTGSVDVVATDGFTGNVVLKTSEGLAKAMSQILKDELQANWLRKLGYIFARGAFKALKQRTDYREVGGAPLLGINGASIICHGSSNAKAIVNAIKGGVDFAEKRVNLKMMQILEASTEAHQWATKKDKRFWSQLKDKIIHRGDDPEIEKKP